MSRETQVSLREYVRRHHEAILLGAILLVALALRLYQLEHDSFWIDELTEIRRSRLPVAFMFKDVLAEVSAVPMEYIITHLVYYYIGRSEGILRLPAVVWGVLSVATVYFLGKRMFDRTTGFLAATILAILPSHVYYSQEMRPYSLAAFMILLTTFAFYHAVERNTRGAWVLYGTTLAVGMYSHYYVAVAGMLHGAYLVLMALAKRLPWNRLLPYAIAAGIAGVLFLPWVLADTVSTNAAFRMPNARTLFFAPFVYAGANYKLTLAQPLTWFAGFVWAFACAGLLLGIAGGSRARNNEGLLALVVLGGMVTVLALDSLAPYFFSTRQFLPYAPLLLLLAAGEALATVRAASRRLPPRLSANAVMAGATVLLTIFAAATLFGSLSDVYRYRKEDWKAASRYLLRHIHSDDVIIARHPYFKYFYAPELADQIVALSNVGTIGKQVDQHARVWILAETVWRRYGYVPDVVAWMDSTKPLEVTRFSGLRLYLYSTQMTREELEASLKEW